ncbi:MAG: rRNA maturation RNase YbeY [Casimicrobiaceae bacterium]|nr:rRNA maturation RNase YbeY [Casimicrobiaceae bacterium]MCX8098512.1 rRNA maturation RNase YbeY [Casimicrobiaceae bacterium]MDW8311615.1 rRNA maturation RNase YbeY [Burkholderiales bacterium]
MRSSALRIVVQYASRAAELPEARQVRHWVRAALDATKARRPVRLAELTVRYIDRPEAQRLNRTFRGRDYAPNVLTFTLSAEAADIAICAPVVRAEAAQQGKATADHHAHLVVHGLLHALGFEHETEADAAEMEALEVEVLARLGIKNPYL